MVCHEFSESETDKVDSIVSSVIKHYDTVYIIVQYYIIFSKPMFK